MYIFFAIKVYKSSVYTLAKLNVAFLINKTLLES